VSETSLTKNISKFSLRKILSLKNNISGGTALFFILAIGLSTLVVFAYFLPSSEKPQITIPSCVWEAKNHYPEERETLFNNLSPEVTFDKNKLGVGNFHVSPDGKTLALEDPEALSINLYTITPEVTDSNEGTTEKPTYTLARFKTIPDAVNPLWKSNKNLVYENINREPGSIEPQTRSLFLLDLSNGYGKRLDTKEANIWNLSYNPTLDLLLYTAGDPLSANQNLFLLDLKRNERTIVAENSTGRWQDSDNAVIVKLESCQTRDDYCNSGFIAVTAYSKNLASEFKEEVLITDEAALAKICQDEIKFNPASVDTKNSSFLKESEE